MVIAVMQPKRYPYHPSALALVFGVIIITCAVLFMSESAFTNKNGLIIDGIFRFDQDGATAILWLISTLTFAGLIFYARMIFVAVFSKPLIELAQAHISAPASISSSRLTRVDFADIRALRLGQYRRHRFLVIDHGNEALRINERFLPDRAGFYAICGVLSEAMRRR